MENLKEWMNGNKKIYVSDGAKWCNFIYIILLFKIAHFIKNFPIRGTPMADFFFFSSIAIITLIGDPVKEIIK